MEDGFGPWRAPGDEDVNRQDLIDALYDTIDIVHSSSVRAGAHGDHPFGLGHLVV